MLQLLHLQLIQLVIQLLHQEKLQARLRHPLLPALQPRGVSRPLLPVLQLRGVFRLLQVSFHLIIF